MNSSSAKRAVLFAMLAAGGIAVVKAAQEGKRPRLSIGIGTVAGIAVLTALAGPAPDIAAGLAGLTVFGAAAASPATIDAAGKSLSVRRPLNKGTMKVQTRVGFTAADALTDDSKASSASSTLTAPNSAGVPQLVPIGPGSHRLSPAAAAALKKAEQLYGRTINVTDSYRSYAQQLAGWQRDPKRFAHPDKSRHVRGEAIDVHTGMHNVRDPALLNALRTAGWCQARSGDEPWHFSINGCG